MDDDGLLNGVTTTRTATETQTSATAPPMTRCRRQAMPPCDGIDNDCDQLGRDRPRPSLPDREPNGGVRDLEDPRPLPARRLAPLPCGPLRLRF